MRFVLLLCVAGALFAQQSVGPRAYVGIQDMSASKWKGPETTVSGLPAASGVNGVTYLVTDLSTAGQCTTGGGSVRGWCRSNGTSYDSVSGGTGSGASAFTDLSDFKLSKVSSTIVVGTGEYRFGSNVTTVSSTSACSVTAGSATELCYFYLTDGALNARAATNTISCTVGGFSQFNFSAGTGFPAGSIPLGTWPMTAGAWDASGYINARPVVSRLNLTQGAGVVVSGEYTIAIDTSVVPTFSAGTSIPGSCSITGGQFFYKTDTHKFYICEAPSFVLQN